MQLWIGAVKGASFDIHYLVQDPVTGEDCVRATSHLAFVEESTGRVLRLTPEQKEKLARFAPERRSVQTMNDEQNPWMVQINKDLGFEIIEEALTMKKAF